MPVPEPENIRIEQLLNEGLRHYGDGRVEQAEACWRQVLAENPSSAMARDYLASAGLALSAKTPTSPVQNAEVIELNPDAGTLAARVRHFLSEKQYDDALSVLTRAKATNPKNAIAIGRSIQHVKDKIVVEAAKAVGSLDQLVSLNVDNEVIGRLEVDDSARLLLSLVDGATTIGDILRAASIERHVALTTMGNLARLRLVRFREATFSLPPSMADDSVSSIYPKAAPPEPSEKPTERKPAAVEFGGDAPDAAYDDIFREATLAYMKGDVASALSLFHRCLELREGDERALHNIRRLSGGPA